MSACRATQWFQYHHQRTGIGLWQIDDTETGSPGTQVDVFLRFGDGYAGTAATTIAKRWCKINGNASTASASFITNNIYQVWNFVEFNGGAEWAGCAVGGDHLDSQNPVCVSNYNAVVNGTASQLSRYSGGGIEKQQCEFYNNSNPQQFTCLYIDPNALVHCGVTCYSEGQGGAGPATSPFYAFHTYRNGVDTEWRYWTAPCTGQSTDYFGMRSGDKGIDNYLKISPANASQNARYQMEDIGVRSGRCRHY